MTTDSTKYRLISSEWSKRAQLRNLNSMTPDEIFLTDVYMVSMHCGFQGYEGRSAGRSIQLIIGDESCFLLGFWMRLAGGHKSLGLVYERRSPRLIGWKWHLNPLEVTWNYLTCLIPFIIFTKFSSTFKDEVSNNFHCSSSILRWKQAADTIQLYHTKTQKLWVSDVERLASDVLMPILNADLEYWWDVQGLTYLDHSGTALPPKTLIERFSKELQTHLIANPHSASSSFPSPSSLMIQSTRRRVLDLFNADPEHFEVVFVANATAGIKLVADAFSSNEAGFDYHYHRDSHTSLVGIRELARFSHCLSSDAETEKWLSGSHGNGNDGSFKGSTLFAYPAQSNMNGRRLPLSWASARR